MRCRKPSLTLFVLLTALAVSLHAQENNPPLIAWESSFGGAVVVANVAGGAEELLWDMQPLPDGGFILGGRSQSIPSGSKTSTNYGMLDGWLVRTDAHGNQLWERSFGGSNHDQITAIEPTSDGGFVLGGFSRSDISGNKGSTNLGSDDYWVIKIDSAGNKLWDRSYGGAEPEQMWSMQKTLDGNFLLAGRSASPASAIKTSPHYGGADLWIVKIDAMGNVLWDRSYGGTNEERLFVVKATPDGGFVLGGTTTSGVGGNKTTGFFGIYDFWVVKVDSSGEKVWEHTFGGWDVDKLHDLEVTPDGGILVGGDSGSPQAGNKESANYGAWDYWLIYLDPSGNKLWERTYGGSRYEHLRDIAACDDGGFVLYGFSDSPVSGVKTSPNFGGADVWVVRIDQAGKPLWDGTYGAGREGFGGSSLQVPGGRIFPTEDGYVFGSHSGSGPPAGNKTLAGYGGTDWWLVKLSLSLPELRFAPNSFSNSIPIRSNALSQTFSVWNGSYSNLHYTISTDVPWATVEPSSGISAFETNLHTVNYNTSMLSTGLYQGSIRFQTNERIPSTNTIALSLRIFQPPPDWTAPRLRIARETNHWKDIHLFLSGNSGSAAYITDFSTNLRTWLAFSTNTVSSNEIELPIPAVTNEVQKAFRTRVRPPQ